MEHKIWTLNEVWDDENNEYYKQIVIPITKSEIEVFKQSIQRGGGASWYNKTDCALLVKDIINEAERGYNN